MKIEQKTLMITVLLLAVFVFANTANAEAPIPRMAPNGAPMKADIANIRSENAGLKGENQGIRQDIRLNAKNEIERMKTQNEGMRADMRNASGTEKAMLKQQINDNRKAAKEQVMSMRKEAFQKVQENNLMRLAGVIKILDNAYGKLTGIIKTQSAAGKDVTEAQKLIVIAQTAIQKVKASVDTFKSFKPEPVPVKASLAADSVNQDVTLEKPRQIMSAIRTDVDNAHKALRAVAMSLGLAKKEDSNKTGNMEMNKTSPKPLNMIIGDPKNPNPSDTQKINSPENEAGTVTQ